MNENVKVQMFERPCSEDLMQEYKHAISNTFDIWKLQEYYESIISKIKKANMIDDKFFSLMKDQAKTYAGLDIEHCKQDTTALAATTFSRLSEVIRDPDLVTDSRLLPALEELADLQNGEPWGFNMFSSYNISLRREELISSVNKSHIEGFKRIITSEKLWNGKSREMKRVFFSSIIEALHYLSDDFPLLTLEPRLAFINLAISDKDYAEHKFFTVYSFKTPEEQQRLRDAASDTKYLPAAKKRFQEIVDGEFKDMVWAI